MIAILTGDIINSRSHSAESWLPVLKEVLLKYGKEPEAWEIFRGDSFQLSVAPKKAFSAAIYIKAALKQLKDLDVRIAIGIGEQDYTAEKISESNGSAFVRSGQCFDNLKNQHLGILTGNEEKDEVLNLLFTFALLTWDSWSPTVATTIKAIIDHPEKNQTSLAVLLKKSQSSVSEALKRGGYDEMNQLDQFFRKQIQNL